jgi:hypothetical protein
MSINEIYIYIKYECVKAHMKVNAEKDVLKNTRNNENDVEHGPETVDVLSNVSEWLVEPCAAQYANLLQSRLLLGWC